MATKKPNPFAKKPNPFAKKPATGAMPAGKQKATPQKK
jgi:hypothetical protein